MFMHIHHLITHDNISNPNLCRYLALCTSYKDNSDAVCTSIIDEVCTFHDCEAYGLPFRTPHFLILEKESVLNPRSLH